MPWVWPQKEKKKRNPHWTLDHLPGTTHILVPLHSKTFFFFFFFFLRPNPRHMEISRLGIKLELQLPTYTTTTDLSHVCNLYHNNVGFLTHWSRPGIEPASWLLVRFISAAPQRELLKNFLKECQSFCFQCVSPIHSYNPLQDSIPSISLKLLSSHLWLLCCHIHRLSFFLILVEVLCKLI